MRWVVLIPLALACFIAEMKLRIFGINPNITVLIAYYAGLRHGQLKGMLAGAAIGVIGDGISGGILGPGMLGKGLVGFLAAYMTEGLFTWTPVLGLVGLPVLTFIDGITGFASLSLFAAAPAALSSAFYIILGQAVLNAAAGPFIKPYEQ